MALLNAPKYDERGENLKRNLIVGAGITFVALVLLTLAGFLAGHGWLFTNLPAEHKVNRFFVALEAKDYGKAFGVYTNDPEWQSHPDAHKDYPVKEFTEDWTTASPVDAPITSHHIDVSRTVGSGNFGTGVVVGVTVNGSKRIFIRVDRKDGTLAYPSPLQIDY